MTNLLSQLAIIISLNTNWTGHVINNKEAGILVTNYSAQIIFENQTNRVELKTTPSSIVVWRGVPNYYLRLITNAFIFGTNGFIFGTNGFTFD